MTLGKKAVSRADVKPQRFKRQEPEGMGAPEAPRRKEVMVSRAGLG